MIIIEHSALMGIKKEVIIIISIKKNVKICHILNAGIFLYQQKKINFMLLCTFIPQLNKINQLTVS